MVSGLAGVVDLFEVEVCPFFADSVSHSDIRFHGAVRIFLLDEIDSNHSLPFIRASFVESLEVAFF